MDAKDANYKNITILNKKSGHIYSLTDPRDGRVRYIGQTIQNPLNKRLSSHICESKRKKNRTSAWIKSLLYNGVKPQIKPLFITDVENLDFCELNTISHYKQFCDLTNHKPGGNSCRGYKLSEETKIKIINSGVYERARLRMLSDKNPGKKQIKTIFPVYKTDEEKKANRLRNSERMKLNNPSFSKKKAIIQLTLMGDFVKEWESAQQIKNTLSIDTKGIRNCCNGHRYYKQSCGFIWKYKNN